MMSHAHGSQPQEAREAVSVDVDQAIQSVAAHLEEMQPELLRQFRAPVGVTSKGDGSVVTDTDLWSERELTPVCLKAIPNSFVVGEETVAGYMDQYASILGHDYVFGIDGVDGTQNFSMGLPLFAPSVGLLQRTSQGHVCVGGAVLFPALRELYYTQGDKVILKDLALGQEYEVQPPEAGITPRSMLTAPDNLLARIAGGSGAPAPRILGCAVADILYVGRGIFAGTISDYALWDFAGALALAERLGTRLQDFETGKPKTAFLPEDFEAGSLKRQWCLRDRYILSHPENFAAVRAFFRNE